MPVQSYQKTKTENTDKSKCWGKYEQWELSYTAGESIN